MGKSTFKTKRNDFVLTSEDNSKLTTLPADNNSADNNKSQNQFVLDASYNDAVKKKDGGNGTSPTESASISQLPAVSLGGGAPKIQENADFLDRDIDLSQSFRLSNPLIGSPSDYFSLKNLSVTDREGLHLSNSHQLRAAQTQKIKTDSEALKNYHKQRIKDINDEIQKINLERSLALPNTGDETADQMLLQSGTFTKELDDKIKDREKYKSDLKNSILQRTVAIELPKYDLSKSSPADLGRKLISVADPDFEMRLNEVESGGRTIPGIIKSDLERFGIASAKEYLQSNPNIPDRDKAIALLNSYEQDFDERNFESTWSRVKDKLGAYFYKDPSNNKGLLQVNSGGTFGYSQDRLLNAVNDPNAGLTPAEKKVALEYGIPLEGRLIGTDIPGSGFLRSFKNAIERSAYSSSNTLLGLVGSRTDADRVYENLNAETGDSRFANVGNNARGQSELAQFDIKEKRGEALSTEEKARKKELQSYVDVRNWWSKFKDGAGDLTGQVLQMAVLTKGLGGVGSALKANAGLSALGVTSSAIGTALTNESVGLFLTSYLNSFDNYKKQAIQLIPDPEKADERNAYAATMSAVEGLSERIFNDTKVLKSFTKEIAPTIQDISTKFITNEITRQAAKEELQTTLKNKLTSFGKEYAKSTLQESTEEGIVDIAQGIADSIYGGKDFDIVKTGKQALETFLTTALYSPVVSGLAAHGVYRHNVSQNAFFRSSLINMAANPTDYLRSVEHLQMSGDITQKEANEKIQLIKSSSNYLNELPETRPVPVSVNVNGQEQMSQEQRGFDVPEITSYVLHRMNEGIINEQLKNTTDPILQDQLNKELVRSQEIRKGIYDGSIGVTPNNQEVTNNPEKANELGILSTEEASNEDLIGTPFEKEKDSLTSNINNNESEISKNNNGENQGQREGSQSIVGESNQEGNVAPQEEGNVVDTPINEPSSDNISVTEMIDRKGRYNGQRGTFIQDGKTVVFQVDDSNREYELGNIDEIGNDSIDDYGIETEQSVANISENGDIEVRGVKYLNPNTENPLSAIVRNDEGDAIAVKLTTEDGKSRTFRGQVAQDLAYQLTLSEINKDNATRQQFEEYINSPEGTIEIEQEQQVQPVEQEEPTQNNEQVSTNEPKRPARKRITKKQKGGANATSESTGSQQEIPTESSKPERERAVSREQQQTKEQTAEQGANAGDSVRGSETEQEKKVSQGDNLVGINQEKNKETREQLGLDNYERTRISDDEINQQAEQEIKNGYDVKKLLERLKTGKSTPSTLEVAILRKYKSNLEAALEKNPTKELLSDLGEFVNSVYPATSEQGRAFRMLQFIQVRDNSLAGFFAEDQLASGREELTEKEIESVKKEWNDINEAEKKYAEKILALEEENARLKAEQELKKQKGKEKGQKKSKEDFRKERKDAFESMREKLAEERRSSNVTIVPYANELIAIAPDVLKVVRSLVEEGVTELAEVVKNIHSQLIDIIPDITEKDVQDIIAGEYNQPTGSRSQVAATLRDLKDQAALINRLEELESGEIPKDERKKTKRIKEIEDLKKRIKEHDLTKLKNYKSNVRRQIEELQEQLERGNLRGKPSQPAVKLDKEGEYLKDKLIKLRQERQARLLKLEYEKSSRIQKIKDGVANILNVPRGIMASLDFSAPLRQAAIVTVNNPKTAALAGLEMFKQAFSQKRFDRWFFDLQNSPRYRLMQDSGLYIADPHDPRMTVREEQFMSNLAEKVPIIGETLKIPIGEDKNIKIPGLGLVKGSERAYVSYLNKMRADLFNRYADAYEDQGFTFDANPSMFKGIASFLNNATGRGNLGLAETAAPILNTAFFSPRLIASRMNILGLGDLFSLGNGYYGNLPPKVRIMAIRNILQFIGIGALTISLIALANNAFHDDDKEKATIETDPRSSDFGKLKIGNTRWDVWAGFQQYVRLVSQLISGETKSVSSGKINDLSGEGQFGKTRADQTISFVRGKLAPVPSFVWDRLAGRTVMGEKKTLGESIKDRLLPLTVADTYSAIRENGVKAFFNQGIPAAFGVGVQNYLPNGFNESDLKKPEYKFLYDRNIGINPPNQGEMTDKQYDSFIKERKGTFESEWNNVLNYGAMINESGNPTVNPNDAVSIKKADELTYDELTKLMKSINNKASRKAKKDLNIKDDGDR